MSTLPTILTDPWPAGAALASGAVQLWASRRIDLGPLTVGLVAVSLLVGTPSDIGGALLVAAGILASGAWMRGARAGVGRPDLTGVVLAVSLVVGVCARWLPPEVPPAALVGVVLLASVLGVGMAFERRGLAGQRLYLYRDVPVRDGEEQA